jgi:hypothetical protein
MIALLDYQEWKTNKNGVYEQFQDLLEKVRQNHVEILVKSHQLFLKKVI